MFSALFIITLSSFHYYSCLSLTRWMDGAFMELDSEAIEAEVDEYWRETYKIQKIFSQRVKKLMMEKDERDREKKRKRRQAEDSGEEVKEDEDEELHVPQALTVCNTCMENMKQFKVRWEGISVTQ